MMSDKPIVWTIAGSDSGGGAGIQADLPTIADLGCHGASIISAVTAQSSVEVTLVEAVSQDMLLSQLNVLAKDMPPKAIKIGLLANQSQLETLANWLKTYVASHSVTVIVDPVMVASCGDNLNQMALDFKPFKGVVSLLTPNVHELCALLGQGKQTNISQASMTAMAQLLSEEFDCHVLAKGGDASWQDNHAFDIYVCKTVKGGSVEHNHSTFKLTSTRVNTDNNHGSGCTLSSAIASFIAHDYVLHDAIVLAKAYVTQGLIDSVKVGQGRGYLGRTGWPHNLAIMPHIEVLHGGGKITHPPSRPFQSISTPLQVYPVVDDVAMLKDLLKSGCKTIQLRIKTAGIDCENNIIQAIQLGRDYQAQVFINDHWQFALKHGAFGVHLGQEDALIADLDAIAKAGLALGLSSHSYFEMLLAAQLNPSYIALGHIFPTTTKVMPSAPQGLDKLANYAKLLKGHFPTVAIGGIDEKVLDLVAKSKVDDIAVVRAVTQAANPQQAWQMLNAKWNAQKVGAYHG